MSSTPEEIKRARLARGLSQEALARLAGVSLKTVGRIERDDGGSEPYKLAALEHALRIGDYGSASEPRLGDASALQLLAELGRRFDRLEELERFMRTSPGNGQ